MARVVVVEDDTALRRMIVEEIEEMGHEVHQADSGLTGLELIRALRPALVCSDINMPGMSGLQLRARLDEIDPGAPRPVFLFISANATTIDIADGLMAGADHYFTKPIDFDRLAAVIDDALGGAPAP